VSLLELHISTSLLILVIVCLRVLAVHHLPKLTFLLLWAVSVLRLWLPVKISSPLSLYNLFNSQSPITTGFEQVTQPIVNIQPMLNTITNAATVEQSSFLPLIWLAVTGALAAWFIVGYVRGKRRFKQALPLTHPTVDIWLKNQALKRTLSVKVSDQISAPLTYGLLHPVILLPKHLELNDTAALTYVLEHELVHIRRFDALSKAVLAATLCLHWYNPLVWLMYVLANRDLELACDEQVLKNCGPDNRSEYALSLIRMEEYKGSCSPLYNHFSKNAIEERITAIMKIKKFSAITIALAVLLVGGISVAFATAAEPDEPAADPIVNYQLVGQTGDIIKTDIIDKDAYQTSDYTVDPDGTATVTDPQTGDNMVIEVNKVEEPDQPTLEIPDDIQVLPEPNNTAHTDEALALAWPVVGNISATFGNRTHPITKEVITHDHIDIIAAEGTDILSAYDGTVIQAEFAADKGYYIVIQHAKGHCTAYGHCSELIAKVGDNVKKGDVIAKVGSTGQSTGAHLAFWVLVYGTAQDPLNFLP